MNTHLHWRAAVVSACLLIGCSGSRADKATKASPKVANDAMSVAGRDQMLGPWATEDDLTEMRNDLIALLAGTDTIAINLYVCGGGLQINGDHAFAKDVTIDGSCKQDAAIEVSKDVSSLDFEGGGVKWPR